MERLKNFFENRLKNFCEDLFFFSFFLESACACVLGPWARAFLSLASRVSVLGKAVLGLGLGFFLCPWPWPRALCPRLHLCIIAYTRLLQDDRLAYSPILSFSLQHSVLRIFRYIISITNHFRVRLSPRLSTSKNTTKIIRPTAPRYLRNNAF